MEQWTPLERLGGREKVSSEGVSGENLESHRAGQSKGCIRLLSLSWGWLVDLSIPALTGSTPWSQADPIFRSVG